MMRKICFGTLLLASGAAQAACTVSSTGIAFGIYNPSATVANDATGSGTLSCTKGSGGKSIVVTFNKGGGASFAGRRMASGSNILPYQIYRDAARTEILGDGTAGTFDLKGPNNLPKNGGTANFTVYGRIAKQLTVNPGSYTDVVIITVTF